MPSPDAVARLLAVPPGRFVAERTALARSLADAGDPAAAEVRKLRRPTGLAWAMNRLAQDRPADVAALLAAGDRLRAGQRRALAGAGAEELRAAEAELRERARALRLAAAEVIAAEGRPATASALSRLELLLRATSTAPGPAREALRAGRLEREPEVAAGDLSGFAVVAGEAAPEVRREGRGTAAPRGPREKPRRASARAGDHRETARAAREARAREAREAAARERARKAAATALARARAAERAADAAAGKADAAARRAAAEAAEAAERARGLRARADAARAEVARREAALRGAGAGPE